MGRGGNQELAGAEAKRKGAPAIARRRKKRSASALDRFRHNKQVLDYLSVTGDCMFWLDQEELMINIKESKSLISGRKTVLIWLDDSDGDKVAEGRADYIDKPGYDRWPWKQSSPHNKALGAALKRTLSSYDSYAQAQHVS